MSEHYFKQLPRTLQEAFGPYTDSQIEGTDPKPKDPLWVRCFYWVIAVFATGCLLTQVSGCGVRPAEESTKLRREWAHNYVEAVTKSPVDEHGVVCYASSSGAFSCVKVR